MMKLLWTVVLSFVLIGQVQALDLSQYLPNLSRAATHDLQTASGEKLEFLVEQGMWRWIFHTAEPAEIKEYWSWTGFGSPNTTLAYLIGDYTYPNQHVIWGENPFILTIPKLWDDTIPYYSTGYPYIGTMMVWDGDSWVLDHNQYNCATIEVYRTTLNSENVIKVVMNEGDCNPAHGWDYILYLSDSIPYGPFNWQKDKGIRRLISMPRGGTPVADLTFTTWVPR